MPHSYVGSAHWNSRPHEDIGVLTADDTIIQSSATDALNLPKLPPKARSCHKFKEITMPLVSVNRLCQSDLEVLFKGQQVTVTDEYGTTVMAGELDPSTELYMVNLQDTPDTYALPKGVTPTSKPIGNARSAYTIKTVPALINFYHITLGAPPIETWLKGIKNGWFTSWPALTVERVKQYCTKKTQTTIGHQQTIRQGINSTKTTSSYTPPH